MDYKKKYLKYKNKYLFLKGGNYSCNLKNDFEKNSELKNLCIENTKGKFKTLEECVSSDDCYKVDIEFANRIYNYNDVKRILKKYNDTITNYYCIDSYNELLSNVSEIKIENILGQGVNGEVYSGSIIVDEQNKIPIAIKKQPLSEQQFKKIMSLSVKYNTESWGEIYGMYYLNKLLIDKISPHINLIYKFFVCEYCKYNEDPINGKLYQKYKYKQDMNKTDVTNKLPCVYIINELSENNLNNWINESHTEYEWYVMLFQILYTIFAYQYTYGMSHGDLHSGNILYSTNKVDKTFIEYNFFGRIINIKNIGYTFKIYDLGKVSSPVIKHYIYTEDNKIELYTKDIKKILQHIIDDSKSLPPNLFKILNKYRLLLLEEIHNEDYINLPTELLNLIIDELDKNVHINPKIINNYKLVNRKYFTQTELNTDLIELLRVKATQNLNKICSACTFSNTPDAIICELCENIL